MVPADPMDWLADPEIGEATAEVLVHALHHWFGFRPVPIEGLLASCPPVLPDGIFGMGDVLQASLFGICMDPQGEGEIDAARLHRFVQSWASRRLGGSPYMLALTATCAGAAVQVLPFPGCEAPAGDRSHLH